MTPNVDVAAAIAAHAENQPDAPALVWRGAQVSYAALMRLAEVARQRIDQLGLHARAPIGVLSGKTPGTIAVILACLRAHRPVMLPSPALPQPVLADLFAAASCDHVLDANAEPVAAFSPGARAPGTAWSIPDGTGLLLTTSGSTGTPKVVPLGRGAINAFVGWAGAAFSLDPPSTVLNYAPLNFDLVLLDVWATLAYGGRVVLVEPDQATNSRQLIDLVTRYHVRLVQAVPMFYEVVREAASHGSTTMDSVEHVIVTGDAIGARTLKALPTLFSQAKLYNLYGCTETNDSFIHELTGVPDGPVAIGQPLPGVEAHIVTDDGTVLRGAGDGELYVHTPFQTPGYLDPIRTVERFTGDPRGLDDRRYFRTGDLVRRDEDGCVFLVGRADHQVKVRGVAVNTAEIEQVLLSHPDVAEAAVVAQSDPVAGRRLVATVRRVEGSALNSLILREYCARRLSAAAIPSALRIIDEPLPKTATGKVDRTAIRRIDELSMSVGGVS